MAILAKTGASSSFSSFSAYLAVTNNQDVKKLQEDLTKPVANVTESEPL